MLYTVNIDMNGFILSVSHTKNDDTELDLDKMDMQHINAYKLTAEGFVLDEERLSALVEEEEQKAKEDEIAQLKEKLNQTDYIMAETFESIMALNNPVTFIADFIKVLVDFKQQYADAIENRKLWRQRIKELEG